MTIFRKNVRGQSSVEYLLMVGFGAVFAIYLMRYFNDAFKEGMLGLERNITYESQSGVDFGN